MSTLSEAYEEQNHLNPIFPVRCSYNLKNFAFPPHYHKGIEVIYVTQGHMTLEVNSRCYNLEAGDLLFVGSYHIHSYSRNTDGSDAGFFMLILDWHYLNDLFTNEAHRDLLAPVLLQSRLIHCGNIPDLDHRIHSIFKNLTHELNTRAPGSELMVMSGIYRLLTLSARESVHDQIQPSDRKQLQKSYSTMRRINRLIYKHYNREITLAEAAASADYSVYHFTRIFRSITGTTFKAYLTDFRINMIKEALISTDLPITDLALSHGFNSLKTFNRNFLKATGMTPTEYRKGNF